MQVHGLRGTKMQRKYPPKNRKASGNNCNKCKRYCCCLFVYLFICILLCFSIVLLHNMNMKCEMYSGMAAFCTHRDIVLVIRVLVSQLVRIQVRMAGVT